MKIKNIFKKKEKPEKVRINRLEALTNCIYIHGHFNAYLSIISFVVGFVSWNLFPFLFSIFILLPEYKYLIDVAIGKAYKVQGNLLEGKESVLYTIFSIKGEDNYCHKTFIKTKDGKKYKVLCYESTLKTTYANKVKIKGDKLNYEKTYYYFPLTKLIVDIDYKCINK
ncbi:MAG: hypothetical protein K6G26_02745 [Lachnospiraceae bacterium]|nr:hypothetical protein [Lachnospiraceae bacterium]